MKRVVWFVLAVSCLSTARAGYEYADRVISEGEYVWFFNWLSGVLVIDGGGGTPIEVRNSSRIEVWSTSSPLGDGIGGIMDLAILNSHLDYYGGLTEELLIGGQNATACLRGGRIDYISSAQYATTEHIFIYACDGWEWKHENGKIRGITGLWWDDGTPFDIRFTTLYESSGYDPVWANVKVVPEPATLLLIGLGAFLLHRRRD